MLLLGRSACRASGLRDYKTIGPGVQSPSRIADIAWRQTKCNGF